jgi:hypothetical protein
MSPIGCTSGLGLHDTGIPSFAVRDPATLEARVEEAPKER